MVAEIDAAAFVLDFAQNNPTIESLREVYEPFLNALRTKHPKTPIIAITAIASSRETGRLDQMSEHVRDVVKRRIAAGDRLLTLVEGATLLGPARLDGLVDGVTRTIWDSSGWPMVSLRILRTYPESGSAGFA